MLKIKTQIALTILLLASALSAKAYVGAQQLNTLSDHGKNTCGFSNMGHTRRGRSQKLRPESKFCHASVVSKTQVLISNSACWKKRYQKSQHKRLSCHGAKQLYELPSDIHSRELSSGQVLVELPRPVPYSPHELLQDQEQRRKWLSDREKRCQVESPYQTRPLSDFSRQNQNSSSIQLSGPKSSSFLKHGAHIICQDMQGQSFLLGQLNAEGLLWPELNQDWPEDMLRKKLIPKSREWGQLQKTRLLCQKNGECLENISTQALKHTEEFIPIIEQLNQSYQNKDLNRSQQELKEDFQDLLMLCQDVAWKIQRAKDDGPDSGLTSGVVGSFEALSLNIAEKFSDDFLVNQFMDIDLISNELNREQVQEIVQKVAGQADQKNLGTIQRLAQTALELSKKVVMNMLLEMDPTLTSEAQESFWVEISSDLKTCLGKAKNVSMIKECSDKFALSAPTLIANKELERQLELNFKQRNDGANYDELKIQAQLSYRNCLQDFYYPERDSEFLGHAQRVKACVYEGILSGYKFTAKAQVKEALSEVSDDPKVIESIQLSSLERAQECEYGRLFHRQERRSQQDYKVLSKLSTADFQSALENCSKGLTQIAGEQVVIETVQSTAEVKENFGPQERVLLSERVIENYYRPCMQAQKDPDPQKCESMIKDLTTLQVAIPMMFEAVDEQMEQLSAESSKNSSHGDEIKDRVQQELSDCHNELKTRHLKELSNNTSRPEGQALSCLEQGIRLVAKGSAKQVIEDGIRNNPQTLEFADKILSSIQIQDLPEQTADCFGRKVRALKSAEELGSSLPKISKDCALETQKSATLLSLTPIINEKLASNLPDHNEREKFIQDFLNGPDGLNAQIESAKSQDELDALIEEVPTQVALRFAKQSVPELVERYLDSIASPQKQTRVANLIIKNLEECLGPRANTQEELDICINQTTSFGHLAIIKEVVHYNALDNLENKEDVASQLVRKSQLRLKRCLDKISQELSSDEFDRRLQPCVTQEIGLISRDIPREAILSLSPLMRSEYGEQELRKQMKKIEKFYLSEGGLDGVDDRDPALSAYMSLNTCITSTRSDIRRSNANVDQAQQQYEKCTLKIKDTIANTIKRKFISAGYEGQDQSHYRPLDTASDILLELTGSPSPSSSQESKDGGSNSDTLELLELVGENTVIACNYNSLRCEGELERTQKEILNYKASNPEATSEELQTKFINSSFMKLVIEANIAKSLKEELGSALSQFEDSEGLLKKQIEKITSPATMNQVMSNRYGIAVSKLVTKAIQEGEIESVVEDPTTRSALGLALIEDSGDNSFADQLLFGLVQPQLNQQRRSSSGVGGIFKNTKVTFGRFFGVVRGRDFDWRRVRRTPQGRRAREIFAREVLLPVLQGKDVSRRSASHSQKSLQDVQLERIQGLIESGIKSLSQ